MSRASRIFAGLLLISIPTVQLGGNLLVRLNTVETAGFHDNPLRQNFFRAGHAHAGVWIILALVVMLYVDRAALSDGLKMLVRVTVSIAPILTPLGFFTSVGPPNTTEAGPMLALVYVGALSLAIGVITLGIGMLRRGPAVT